MYRRGPAVAIPMLAVTTILAVPKRQAFADSDWRSRSATMRAPCSPATVSSTMNSSPP